MRIIEIIPTLGAGGAERFVTDLSNSLCEQGNDVHVVLLMKMTPKHSLYVKDLNPTIHVYSLNKDLGFSFIVLWKLIKLIFNIRPNLIHAHLNALFYVALPAILNCWRIKYIYTVHNDANKDASNRYFAMVMKYLFSRKKVLPITISDASERSFKEFYGFHSYKTIFNGRTVNKVSISDEVRELVGRYRRTNDTIVFLYLARFTEQKRPYLHAKVCNDLYKEGYDVALMMFGEDLSNGEYLHQIESLQSECVHVFGVTSKSLEYMKACDALLLLSNYEGMPIVVIESMAVGCIPICTPVGGVKDIIESGVNGFLADDCSEKSCYNILKEYLQASIEKKTIIKEKKSYEE